MANNMMMEQRAGDITANAQTQIQMGRQSQEVQAAVFMAKQFPRNTQQALQRCLDAAKRKGLAQAAVYEYPKGGTRVTGPSIRLAEALAQNWGNIDTGVIELERRDGESTAMAYAWDLETNYRQTKTFTVKHVRETKSGSYPLTDSREIYELVANMGARRQRACILGVIPGDVVEEMVNECERTLANNEVPLDDRIRQMIGVFQNECGVTVQQLEEYAGMNIDAFSEQQYRMFERIYISIRDGMKGVEDYFGQTQKSPEQHRRNRNDSRNRDTGSMAPRSGSMAPRSGSMAPRSNASGQIDMNQLSGNALSEEEKADIEAAERIAAMEEQGKFNDI